MNEDLFEPRAIAVAPALGWMFWTDWNEKRPKIERSNLDGSERVLLITKDVVWPNGIALDLERKKIYWCDAKTDRIEVSNMDGTDRREVITDNLPHLFGLSLLGDYLYWTDWQRRSIDRAHKLTGGDRETIVDQMPNVMGIKAVHLGQKNTNTSPCARDNGGCSHLCFNKPNDRCVLLELRESFLARLPDIFYKEANNHTFHCSVYWSKLVLRKFKVMNV